MRGLAWLVRSTRRDAWLEKVLDRIKERVRKEPDHVEFCVKGSGILKRGLPFIVFPLIVRCVYKKANLPCASAWNVAGHEPSSANPSPLCRAESAKKAFIEPILAWLRCRQTTFLALEF